MSRALIARCLLLLAFCGGLMLLGPDAAAAAELPDIIQNFKKRKSHPYRSCERPHRRSVVRKPLTEAPPCPECPQVIAPCASCPCDLDQLVELLTSIDTKIANDKANVTSLDKRLEAIKKDLEALIALNGKPPFIERLPEIETVLKEIRTAIQKLSPGDWKNLNDRLLRIVELLEHVATNTRKPGVPEPPRPSQYQVIFDCMKDGQSYYLGGGGSFYDKRRCMDESVWKTLIKEFEKRPELCTATAPDFPLSEFLADVKKEKFVGEIRLVGLVLSQPLTLANVEIEAPLRIEQSTFCKRVHFGNATINHQLSLDGSLFRENLEFSNSKLGEGLRIRDAVTNSVALSSTTVNGALDLSNTVALQPWSLIGGHIGQLEATRADMRDLNLTDIEIKRRFSAEGVRIRGTLLLEGAIIGSDVNLGKARLTHTTLRRAILKSDLRLQNVEARCSTKVHKTKIEGDLVIDKYAFGKVTVDKELDPTEAPPIGRIDQFRSWLWGTEPRIPERVSGAFHWLDLPPTESDPFASETQQRKLSLAPNQDADASTCEIITPEDKAKKTARFEYRSSGILGLIDSTVGGSLCINDVTWQRGLRSGLATRFNDSNKDYDPQSVLSFDGSSVGKYTILGSIKHPEKQPNDERRIDAARLQLIGFKTTSLMSLWESSETEYRKLITQLDVQTVLKATGGCQLDDIGFSRTQPGVIAPPSKASRVAGADFPNSKHLLDWLRGVEPYTSQPHVALIAALTRSGIDPVELREAKLWRDLGVDGRTWLTEPWTLSGLYHKFIDGIQIGIRGVNGFASGFTLRPAGSLVLALLFVTLILVVLRRYHGHVAYLAVPKTEVLQGLKQVNDVACVELALFRKHATEWRVIGWPRAATLMLPRLFSAIPLLGDLFGKAPLNWSSETIIGFRFSDGLKAGESIDDDSVSGLPPHWDSKSDQYLDELVELPHSARTFSYLEQTVEDRWNQIRDNPSAVRATYPAPVLTYLPGLIPAPQSGSLLATLKRWAWYGVAVAAVLASGVIALFKFGS